jgi:transposase InsO family protein
VREKRALIEKHRGDLPFSRAAHALGLSRKNRYKKEVTPSTELTTWKTHIEKILTDFPCYGYRRVTATLKRQSFTVNHKKIMRIMHATGLKQKKRKWKPRTTDSRHKLRVFPNRVKDIVPRYPHHLWVSDITYVQLPSGFCYAAIVLDVFTRKVVGWSIALSMEQALVIDALDMALHLGTPAFHHSDRGGQYCATEYVKKLEDVGATISMADTGVSVDNPFAESFNRTLKVEEVYLREYQTFDDAKQSINTFIVDVYNAKRLHSSLGYLPPNEFEALWKSQQLQKDVLKLQLLH